ncbi:invasion associated locus B family protein [Arenibaculum pallidiluteum]|uniref:invasion associated locus B family protein n=1 Tax=Arenibaculum pallidiluteum TaxID=2812559 RepID=UPI001A96FFF3|nr:invasion associated locus B family protein [Arenibaculum pallidiluteum]
MARIFRPAVMVCAAWACVAWIASAAPLSAKPSAVGSFGRWTVFASGSGAGRVCYMGGLPLRSEGKYTRRDRVVFYVAYRPGERGGDEVSVLAGYPYRRGSQATLTIDGATFRLITDGDTAWAATDGLDRRIVRAVRAGSRMVVKGTSARGTLTTDTYDLEGSAAAYAAMREACR